MNAYIKDESIILNCEVNSLYKEDLLKIIENSKHKNVTLVPTYDIQGNVCGAKIKIK